MRTPFGVRTFLCFCETFRFDFVSAVGIFIAAASGENDLLLGIAFDAHHDTATGLLRLPDLALVGWNLDLFPFVGKITEKAAEGGGVVLVISDSEKLVAAEKTQVEDSVVGYAAVYVVVCDIDGKDVFAAICA